LFDNLTEVRIPKDLEMCCSPDTNSCISGRKFEKDKSGMLPPCSAAAPKMISARVDSMADCIHADLLNYF
jgi:hypothetical protein